MAGFLKDVGCGLHCRTTAFLDFVRRALANRVHVGLNERDHAMLPIVSEYERLFRTVGDVRDQWAGGYLHYRLYGTEHPDYTAIEPPEGHWIRDYWALWDQIAVEADERRRDALYAEVLELRRREIPIIGLLGEATQPLVVAEGLRNVRTTFTCDCRRWQALLAPQQLYWEAPGHTRWPPPEPKRPRRRVGRRVGWGSPAETRHRTCRPAADEGQSMAGAHGRRRGRCVHHPRRRHPSRLCR